MSVIPTTVSTLFLLLAVFVIIPDPPYDTFDALWIYVSFPIYLGTLICTVVLSSWPGHACAPRDQPARE